MVVQSHFEITLMYFVEQVNIKVVCLYVELNVNVLRGEYNVRYDNHFSLTKVLFMIFFSN